MSWLERNGDAPFFLWVHYYDPHGPYSAPEPFLDRYADQFNVSNRRERDRARYLGEVAYTDAQVGRILDTLRTLGVRDQTAVVITSDHGLRPSRVFEREMSLDRLGNWMPRIPLAIKAPGLPPGTYDVDYQHIDLLPTILDLMDWPYDPDEFDGVSVLTPDRPPRKRVFSWKPFSRSNFITYEYHPSEDVWLRVLDPTAGDREH